MSPMSRMATCMFVMSVSITQGFSCRRDRPRREPARRSRSVRGDARTQIPSRSAQASFTAEADRLNQLLRQAIEAADKGAGRDEAVSFVGLEEMASAVLRMALHGPNASWWDYLERVAAFVDRLKASHGKKIDSDRLALLAQRFNEVVTANNAARMASLPSLPRPADLDQSLDVQTARHKVRRLTGDLLTLVRAYRRFGPKRGLQSKVAALRLAALSRPLIRELRGIRCGHPAKACHRLDRAVRQAVAVTEQSLSGPKAVGRAAGASPGSLHEERGVEMKRVRSALERLAVEAARD